MGCIHSRRRIPEEGGDDVGLHCLRQSLASPDNSLPWEYCSNFVSETPTRAPDNSLSWEYCSNFVSETPTRGRGLFGRDYHDDAPYEPWLMSPSGTLPVWVPVHAVPDYQDEAEYVPLNIEKPWLMSPSGTLPVCVPVHAVPDYQDEAEYVSLNIESRGLFGRDYHDDAPYGHHEDTLQVYDVNPSSARTLFDPMGDYGDVSASFDQRCMDPPDKIYMDPPDKIYMDPPDQKCMAPPDDDGVGEHRLQSRVDRRRLDPHEHSIFGAPDIERGPTTTTTKTAKVMSTPGSQNTDTEETNCTFCSSSSSSASSGQSNGECEQCEGSSRSADADCNTKGGLNDGVPSPIFSSDWQDSQTFFAEGGFLRQTGSDVILHVPPGAVERNTQIKVHSSICADVDHIRHLMNLSENEEVVSPLVEYCAGEDFEFQSPVSITLRHCLPADFDADMVQIYHLTRGYGSDLAISKIKKALDLSKESRRTMAAPADVTTDVLVQSILNMKWTMLDREEAGTQASGMCLFALDTAGNVQIITNRFCGYVCTFCHAQKKKNVELYAVGRGSSSHEDSCLAVTVSVHVWDARLKVADFRKLYKIEPPDSSEPVRLLKDLKDSSLHVRLRLFEETASMLCHRKDEDGQLIMPVKEVKVEARDGTAMSGGANRDGVENEMTHSFLEIGNVSYDESEASSVTSSMLFADPETSLQRLSANQHWKDNDGMTRRNRVLPGSGSAFAPPPPVNEESSEALGATGKVDEDLRQHIFPSQRPRSFAQNSHQERIASGIPLRRSERGFPNRAAQFDRVLDAGVGFAEDERSHTGGNTLCKLPHLESRAHPTGGLQNGSDETRQHNPQSCSRLKSDNANGLGAPALQMAEFHENRSAAMPNVNSSTDRASGYSGVANLSAYLPSTLFSDNIMSSEVHSAEAIPLASSSVGLTCQMENLKIHREDSL